jgi:hypothetical protein
MFDRPGLLNLVQAAKNRSFDAVIVEQLDRISRDQADMAGIAKRLKFAETVIITNDGVVNDIVIGVRGIVSSMFVKDLGDKIRRGLTGLVRDGKIPGKPAYGYRVVPGKPGVKEVDLEQAKIVRRIFREYADGKLVRQIAADLTADKIPTPTGGTHWSHPIFGTGGGNNHGMIGNRLYIGELVWNTHHAIKNPETEKRTRRKNSTEEVIAVQHPHLRIIPQDLWDRAQAVVAERSIHMFGSSRKPRAYGRTQKDYIVAGLLTCSTCGGHMRIMRSVSGNVRVGCYNAIIKSACEHAKTYSLTKIENTVLAGLKHNLDADALTSYVKGYHEEWKKRQRRAATEREAVENSLNRVTVQIDRIVTAISDSDEPVKALVDKLKTLEIERASLSVRLKTIEAEGNVVTLLPGAIKDFGATVRIMHDVLTDPKMANDRRVEMKAMFRNIFERIVVHPTGKRRPIEVTPYARIGAIMGVDLFPQMRTPEEMLAEQGVANPLLESTSK